MNSKFINITVVLFVALLIRHYCYCQVTRWRHDTDMFTTDNVNVTLKKCMEPNMTGPVMRLVSHVSHNLTSINSTYDNNMICKWTLSPPHDKLIVLNFTNVEIEGKKPCMYDSLSIQYKLLSHSDNQTLKICSNYTNLILVPDSLVKIKFETDSTIVMKGFEILFWYINRSEAFHYASLTSTIFTKTTCPKIEKNSTFNGSISFYYPDSNYWSQAICEWNIEVPIHHYLIAQFTHFNLETVENNLEIDSSLCERGYNHETGDFVKVQFSVLNYDHNLFFCGSNKTTVYTNQMIATDGNFRVRFVSDYSIEGTGFILNYNIVNNASSLVKGECPKLTNLSKHGNIRYRYELNKNTRIPLQCHEKIEVPLDMMIGINIKRLSTPQRLLQTDSKLDMLMRRFKSISGYDKCKDAELRINFTTNADENKTSEDCCEFPNQLQNTSSSFCGIIDRRTFISYSNTVHVFLNVNSFSIADKLDFLLEFTAIPTIVDNKATKCPKAIFKSGTEIATVKANDTRLILKEFTIHSNKSNCLTVEKLSFSTHYRKYEYKSHGKSYSIDDEHYLDVFVNCESSRKNITIYFFDEIVSIPCKSNKDIFRRTDDQFTIKFPDTNKEVFLRVRYMFPKSSNNTDLEKFICPTIDTKKHYKESIWLNLFTKVDERTVFLSPTIKTSNSRYYCKIEFPPKKGYYILLDFLHSMDKSDISHMCNKWYHSRQIHPQLGVYESSRWPSHDNLTLTRNNDGNIKLCYNGAAGNLNSRDKIRLKGGLMMSLGVVTESYVSFVGYLTNNQSAAKFSTIMTYEYVPYCPHFKISLLGVDAYSGSVSIPSKIRYRNCLWHITPPDVYRNFTVKLTLTNFNLNCEDTAECTIDILNKYESFIRVYEHKQEPTISEYMYKKVDICGEGNYTRIFTNPIVFSYSGIMKSGFTMNYLITYNGGYNATAAYHKNMKSSRLHSGKIGFLISVTLNIAGLLILIAIIFKNRKKCVEECYVMKRKLSQNRFRYFRQDDTTVMDHYNSQLNDM